MNRLLILLLLNFFFCILIYPPEGLAQKDLKLNVAESQIDSLFEPWNDLSKPGIAIGVVKNGKIDHLKAYGSANLEHKIPNQVSTKFLYPGLSDQIIVYAILQMDALGKLSLEDKIDAYFDLAPALKNKIQIKHLIHHNSGINDLVAIKELSAWSSKDKFSYNQTLAMLQRQSTLEAEPGTKYIYNKTGLRLLQDIIEKVSGKTINEYCTENIFTPLGMTHSLYLDSHLQMVPNSATGYYKASDSYEKGQLVHNESEVAHFYTSIEDVCKWALTISEGIKHKKGFLPKIDELCAIEGETAKEENMAKYLGQHNYWDFKGVGKLYLIGMNAGYAAKLIRFPEHDLSIVVLGNAGDYNGHWTSFTADLYLKNCYPKPEEKKQEAFITLKDNKELTSFCGTFWDSDIFVKTAITLENDTLVWNDLTYGWGAKLMPIDQNKFAFLDMPGYMLDFDKENKSGYSLHRPRGVARKTVRYNEDAIWHNNLTSFTGAYYSQEIDTEYILVIKDGELFLSHKRQKEILLSPLMKDTFKSKHKSFKEITFIRNASNEIVSFEVSNMSIKKHSFKKSKDTTSNM